MIRFVVCWKYSLTVNGEAADRKPDMTTRNSTVLTLCSLLLSACATPGAHTSIEPINADIPARIGNALEGELLALDNQEFGTKKVKVLASYTAASGRACRKLATAEGAPLARVSCQRSDGSWYLGRSLSTSGVVRKPLFDGDAQHQLDEADSVLLPLVPADGSATSTVEPVVEQPVSDVFIDSTLEKSDDMVVRELAAGETLWSFSERVTGNPMNWQKIASANDIEDSRTVALGQSLDVPVALIRHD